MQYRIEHQTRFTYEHPVVSSQQMVHLTPRQFDRQEVLDTEIHVEPKPTTLVQREDYFGNTVTEILVRQSHALLTITSKARVNVLSNQDILLDLSPSWESVARLAGLPESWDSWDAARFCFPSQQISLWEAREYAAPLVTPGKPYLRLAMELTEKLYAELEYRGGVTDVYTPVPKILEKHAGVCQDFAHVGIACLRAYGLPARYVSGYLLTQPPAGQPRLTGADASHAWFSVWCPEFGWVDFDPTNNMRTQNEHITLGWGRDYSDVSPTRGFILGGGTQTLEVAVDVIPIQEGNP